MFKKLFFIGLGITIMAAKKSALFLLEKRGKSVDHEPDPSTAGDEVAAEPAMDSAVESRVDTAPAKAGQVRESDDLTDIKGIGPTYAKRLYEAGIKTFVVLSQTAPDDLRSITQARGQAANAESWILQAAELAQ